MASSSCATGVCLLLLTTIAITFTISAANMSYWVAFSKRITPGEPLAVSVFGMGGASGPVTLTLDLLDNAGDELQDTQNFVLSDSRAKKNDIQIVQFLIDAGVTGFSMFIRAQAFGGLSFDGFERVSLTTKRLSIFIQTDKTTYLPGQTVQFRALSMLPDLTVTQQLMDVVIRDPSSNRIAQWLNVTSDDDTGVFQGAMATSLFPPLGDWQIRVTVGGVSETKIFKLEEYELPLFEVTVKFPNFALTTDDTVIGKVTAKYTFGSPVPGTGQLVAKYQHYRASPATLVKEFTLDQNGQADVEFTREELTDLATDTINSASGRPSTFILRGGATFGFEAIVTNSFTDDVMTDDTSLTFYERRLSLNFMPITPSTYKPGLSVTVYVEALEPDGQTPLAGSDDVSVTFTVTAVAAFARFPIFQPKQDTILTTAVKVVDKNGIAQLTIDTSRVPEGTTRLSVEVESEGATAFRRLDHFLSPSNSFVQLKLRSKTPKIGGTIKLLVRSNVKFRDYTYQVISKSRTVLSKAVRKSATEKGTQADIKIKVTSAMAPLADVIVFFCTSEGEVVADRLSIAVDGASAYEVKLKFKKNEVKPGAKAALDIRAAKGATVFLLGVDKSVQLLGTGNDITRQDVMSELVQYGSGNSFLLRGFWYYYNRGTDASDVFREANAGLITDGTVPGESFDVPTRFREIFVRRGTNLDPIPELFPVQEFAPVPEFFPEVFAVEDAAFEVLIDDSVEFLVAAAPAAETPAERLRTFFPETWLWQSVNLKEKKLVLKQDAPDTITTWVVSAFATHPKLGFAVSDQSAELLTIKRLFVTLDLPFSAVRGEDVCVTALTFNRYTDPLQVSIVLAKNASAFDNTLIIGDASLGVIEINFAQRIVYDLGVLQPNSQTSSVFCIKPRALGDLPLTVFLQADRPADGLVKTFKVKPEGVERSQSYPVLIEIPGGAGAQFSTTVLVILPPDIVQGSLRMRVTLVGDILGSVAENLDDLLRMPYGCGEQNLINFAPNTYIIFYLRATGRLTPAILTKAKSFMVSGYQRQLNYKHPDGAYSAFGQPRGSTTPGSTWLTAFTIKCFVQAADLGDDVIVIDPDVVNQGVIWMTRQQNLDGSFREPGRVIHQELQGGSAQGVGLAAYVTIALQEAYDRFSSHMTPFAKAQVPLALSKAVTYLEGQLAGGLSDTYTYCIVAYALTLTASGQAGLARLQMQQRATVADSLRYWEAPASAKQVTYPWYRTTEALNIEMTAYALLTLMHEDRLTDAVPVFRWLNTQRGDKGGFISTQDTVLGIEALATMADLALGDNFSPIEVDISWTWSLTSGGVSLTIDEDSVLLLQRVDIPVEDDVSSVRLTLRATSDGAARAFALAEVTVFYNLDSATVDQAFAADAEVSDNTARSFVLTICLRRTRNPDVQSMVVLEVGVPSGYQAVVSRSDLGLSDRQEYPEGLVVLYYTNLGGGDCPVLHFAMTSVVANSKPSLIRVYDYYKPDDEFTTYYSLKQFGVCDLEPDYMACPFA